MISIKDLTVAYKKGYPILNRLNLTLDEQLIHGLVGLNGTGKTTLFNTIFGLKKPQKGTIFYQTERLTKNEMAYLPTELYFFYNITGREYLALFKNKTFDAECWNELFKLPLDQIIDEYSTGMRKRLAFLGVIKQDKPILLLDEPFNGLDVELSRIVHLILLRLKELGKTILISSHIVETLTGLCDRIHYLEAGLIKYDCAKENFTTFEKELYSQIERDYTGLINSLLS